MYDDVLPCDCILTAREMRKITPVATVTGTAAADLKLPLDKLVGNAEPGQNGLAWQPGFDRIPTCQCAVSSR